MSYLTSPASSCSARWTHPGKPEVEPSMPSALRGTENVWDVGKGAECGWDWYRNDAGDSKRGMDGKPGRMSWRTTRTELDAARIESQLGSIETDGLPTERGLHTHRLSTL